MKAFILGCIFGLTVAVLILALFGDDDDTCERLITQERAGSQIVTTSLRERVEEIEVRLSQVVAAKALLAQEYRVLQQEFGTSLGAKVVIPEPAPLKVAEIAELAAAVSVEPGLWPQIKAGLTKEALARWMDPARMTGRVR